ncbi:MAG: cache domain-containing protein [Sulfurimonas sp.]|nr:cache domain-containing protein [Sulfurimonas sp.]
MFKSKILYKTMFLIGILIAGYISAMLIHALPEIQNKINFLERENIELKLENMVSISKVTYKDLESFKKNTLQSRKKHIKATTYLAYSIVEDYYDKYKKNQLTEKEAKKLAFTKISNLSYYNNGYFFILNDNYTLVYHSNTEGQKHIINEKNNSLLTKMVNKTRKNGEAFTLYFEKLSYIKTFKPWAIYIGTEINIDDINKDIKKRENELLAYLKNIITTSKIDEDKYIFVFNEQGKVLIHPNADMININLKKLKNKIKNNILYDDLTKAAKSKKILKYKWDKSNDINNDSYKNILKIEYIPELKWYIAISAHVKKYKESLHKLQRIVITFAIAVFAVSIVISFVFFKKLLQPISMLSEMVNSAIQGDYSVRSNIKTNDEIGLLSKNFNIMLETIEKNIQKEKQISEQSRLAQMGEMLSMIAHQWRQPLGAIGSAVINIQMKIKSKKYKLDDAAERDRFLKFLDEKHNNINEYTQFLSTTIDDFRSFFRPDKKKEEVALTTPIIRALTIVEPPLKNKNIEITKKFLTNDKVLIYQNELMQVILNILKNSEDNFLEKNTAEPKINISTKNENGSCIIMISDNGGGIPKNILPKIFEPYFSTKLEKNATGLGLYMSKIIIEEHNGGILRVNNTDDGICFEIVLYKQS